jgi:MFS transporter, DHA3 family, macrolide efflux protein
MIVSGNAGSSRRAVMLGITWTGQLVSIVGSGLTEFAVSVRVYQLTQSITQLSLVAFFTFLPTVLLSPFAGVLVDRWDRRRAMLLADLGAGLSASLLLALLVFHEAGRWALHPAHFYLFTLLSSTFAALRVPAYYAATAALVPKAHLGRANALVELANGSRYVLSPILAGVLMRHVNFLGIVVIDLGTFLFAVGSLLVVRFPAPADAGAPEIASRSLRREVLQGWSFIAARRGLLGLVLYVTANNLITSMAMVLMTPFVLAFTDAEHLGFILSFAGAGMLLGALIMSAWGGPRRRVVGIFAPYGFAGLALCAAVVPPSVPLTAAMAFLYFFFAPFCVSCLYALWQSKVPLALQGRVFAARRMIAISASAVGPLLCGPLVDGLIEPWLAPGGALASTVGRVVGTGHGRGVAALLVLLGLLTLVVAGATWSSRQVRHVEDELPDALPG